MGTTFKQVNAGVEAILSWIDHVKASMPATVVERLLFALEARRWSGLGSVLICLRRLIDAGLLSNEQISRLDSPLGDLIGETTYQAIEPTSIEAVTASLVRRGCVRLADSMSRVGAAGPKARCWLELASTDPLPEVRYALEEEFD